MFYQSKVINIFLRNNLAVIKLIILNSYNRLKFIILFYIIFLITSISLLIIPIFLLITLIFLLYSPIFNKSIISKVNLTLIFLELIFSYFYLFRLIFGFFCPNRELII